MSLVKVIPPGSFDFGMPTSQLVNVWSRGVDKAWMQKRAAVLTRELAALRPEPGYSYIHLISMGAYDTFGLNRNGDGFNAKSAEYRFPHPKPGINPVVRWKGGLEEYHPTFTKYGHVYKHHLNRDPAQAIGEIRAEAFNPEMQRGELIIRVRNDHPDWRDELEKLARDESVPFSMSIRIPHDTCLYCGNQARTREEYCDHLANNLTTITKEGHQIGAMNDHGIFFDISKVIRPADRIAWSFGKVAALGTGITGGAQLAEQLGVSAPVSLPVLDGSGTAVAAQKLAAAHKLAAIEKQIEVVAQGGSDPQLQAEVCGCPFADVGDSDMRTLQSGDSTAVLNSLTDAKICLNLRDFLRLVTGEKFASVEASIPAAQELLPGMFGRLLESGDADACAADRLYESAYTAIPRQVRSVTEKLAAELSLTAAAAQKRAMQRIVTGQKPVWRRFENVKSAAVSKQASVLAKEYATYVLAFDKAANDELASRLTVLRHYLTLPR